MTPRWLAMGAVVCWAGCVAEPRPSEEFETTDAGASRPIDGDPPPVDGEPPTDTAPDAGEAPLTQRNARVSIASDYGCALDAQGEPRCLGRVRGTTDEAEAHALLHPPPGPYRSLAVADHFGCGVTRDEGRLSCWGHSVPTDLLPDGVFTEVRLGGQFQEGCALEASGRARCWGTGHRALDGRYVDVALNRDIILGYVLGLDAYGTARWVNSAFPDRPAVGLGAPDDDPLVAIGPGEGEADTFCLIQRSGAMTCYSASGRPTTHEVDGDFVQVTEGCALGRDGEVTLFGWTEIEPPPGPFTQVACLAGPARGCGLRPDDSMECFGLLP